MPSPKAEKFYQEILDILIAEKIPFMVGGTYAFTAYTGIMRETKDLDLITTKENTLKALQLLGEKGFATELLDPLWIGKIYHDDIFIDIIFAERNNIYQVTKPWFENPRFATVMHRKLQLMPLEYMISTKAYVAFREKYDGSDINYLLLQHATKINWDLLVARMKPDWQLLFMHLIMFMYVFPSAKETIPPWVIQKYVQKLQDFLPIQVDKKITKGHLISYEYVYAIEKLGFVPT